jgi:RNA polymerase sigma-70 factor (ECF subfamily)
MVPLNSDASDPTRAPLALVRTTPDAPLLPRIAAGDAGAVEACVARHGALVWSLARRWRRDHGDAEDVAQEIFTDLWRTAARFDASRMSESGWVAMVARRRLIDRARRDARQPVLEAWPEAFDPADEREVDPDRALRVERARAALRQLPAAQREALELALLDGHTHEEIAARTGRPLGTIKSHIRRGIARVRVLLGTATADEEDTP